MQMNLNNKNYVLASNTENFNKVVMNSEEMDKLFNNKTFYLSALVDPNNKDSERKKYKISKFVVENI